MLYIPLWLYSHFFTFLKIFYISSLYIPLWLYSHKNKTNTSYFRTTLHSTLVIFTFRLGHNASPPSIVFTFHSGYIHIYMVLCFSIKTNFFTFHSGYIHIKFSFAKFDSPIILYIPLWLYSHCKKIRH